jgi:tRNA pseudouridine55 synthase
MVSAIKKDGVPLYKLARKGIEVEREARMVHVYSFTFSNYQEPIGRFRVACTKGTYVRSLAHDLGKKVGCGAHLLSLRRAASGKFDVSEAVPFEAVMTMTLAEMQQRIVPFLKLLA